jgi:hypothetical protein
VSRFKKTKTTMRDWIGACFKIENGRLLVLDQTKLPDVENWVVASTPDDMITLILDLRFAHHALPSTPFPPCASCVRRLAYGIAQETRRRSHLVAENASWDLQHSRRTGDRLWCCIFARDFRRGWRVAGGGARHSLCTSLRNVLEPPCAR